MAQPQAYNREKNFILNSGRETDHAALNAELDRASNSINGIRENLAILQADDGRLRSSIVTSDALSDEVTTYVIDQVMKGASEYAEVASTSAELAVTSRDAASQSERNALTSQNAAKASEAAAAVSMQAASESETNAGVSRNVASSSAASAVMAAQSAEISRLAAQSLYGDLAAVKSAATVAAASSTSASNSASAADRSATSAISASETAATSESRARSSMEAAAVSEMSALASKNEASVLLAKSVTAEANAAFSAQEAALYADQASTGQVNSNWNATSGKALILNKPALSAVATSGSYNDLSDKPVISFAEMTGKPTTLEGYGITDAASASTVSELTSMLFSSVEKGLVTDGSTITFSFSDGEFQTATFNGGTVSIELNGYIESRPRSMMLQLNGAGQATIHFPDIYWVVPDGTYTTNIATYLGIIGREAFSSTMPTWILLWNAADIIYGKML